MQKTGYPLPISVSMMQRSIEEVPEGHTGRQKKQPDPAKLSNLPNLKKEDRFENTFDSGEGPVSMVIKKDEPNPEGRKNPNGSFTFPSIRGLAFESSGLR
ncbi:MAG: hypothetical protein GY940_47385 [bacterium]|nr:hypothetical protein [bacterium]